MEPRIYQFYNNNNNNNNTRAVSPSLSNWSPIVPNPLDNYQEQEAGYGFPMIQRSFAFDEWDDDSSDEASSFVSSGNNDDHDEAPRHNPETLDTIPSVAYGRTIYDATQQPASKKSKVTRPTLDTYMTVIYLDDNVVKGSFSTSTETFGNNETAYHHFQHPIHSQLLCQSIPRQSKTYRWTSATPPASNQPPVMPHHDLHNDADERSYSSSESEPPCPPIPEYITVYKNE
jgi:hypothetical protein